MKKFTYMKTQYDSDARNFGIKIESSSTWPKESVLLLGPGGSISLDTMDYTKELRDFLNEYIKEVEKEQHG